MYRTYFLSPKEKKRGRTYCVSKDAKSNYSSRYMCLNNSFQFFFKIRVDEKVCENMCNAV